MPPAEISWNPYKQPQPQPTLCLLQIHSPMLSSSGGGWTEAAARAGGKAAPLPSRCRTLLAAALRLLCTATLSLLCGPEAAVTAAERSCREAQTWAWALGSYGKKGPAAVRGRSSSLCLATTAQHGQVVRAAHAGYTWSRAGPLWSTLPGRV